jgi:hypothetical protein
MSFLTVRDQDDALGPDQPPFRRDGPHERNLELEGRLAQTYSENKELCGSDRFKGNPVAQPLNSPRELVDEMGLSTVIEVMGPQLPIGSVTDEHMEGTDHD